MTEAPSRRLPRDPEYWGRLAQRIRDDAAAPLAAYASGRDDCWRLLARRAPSLVGALAAGILILWLRLPRSESSVALEWMEQRLAPSEIAGVLMGGPEPPSVDALMVQFPPGLEEEP